MSRDPGQKSARRSQRGFALIAAITLLVVLAGTSAAMVRLIAVQQAGTSRTLLAERAELAAHSGLQWGLHRVATLRSCPAASSTLTLTEGALNGFRVLVRCTTSAASPHFEGVADRIQVQLDAEASYGALGGSDFVFRTASANFVR